MMCENYSKKLFLFPFFSSQKGEISTFSKNLHPIFKIELRGFKGILRLLRERERALHSNLYFINTAKADFSL